MANEPSNRKRLKNMGSLADSDKSKLCIVDSPHASTGEIPGEKKHVLHSAMNETNLKKPQKL